MLRPLVLSLMVSAVAVPAMAQDIKPEVEKIGAAYADCVAKHDGACVASLYSKDGIQVNVVGEVKTDLKATYEDYFKGGEDKIAVKVNYAQPLGNDMALAAGDVDITFNVEPKLRPAFWSAVYVKAGGQWKIRMLTAGIKPPPPPEQANAK